MTKERLLEELWKAEDFLSGEELGARFGVTRSAISLCVQRLREEGYVIDARHKRGYRIIAAPDALQAPQLRPLLGDELMERVHLYDSVESTNTVLAKAADSGAPDGSYVLANEQTAGRGRRGRSFVSPRGKGIYLSVLLRPHTAPEELMDLTAWTAVAIRRAVYAACGVKAGIKWVNDLILDGRKICGILSEMALEGESREVRHVIIGIGINVTQEEEDFPPELRQTAGSLRMSLRRKPSLPQLAAQMILAMEQLRRDWPREKETYLKEYREADILDGQEIRVLSGESERDAKALGISPDFGLLVEYRDGAREELRFGEVSIRGDKTYVPFPSSHFTK